MAKQKSPADDFADQSSSSAAATATAPADSVRPGLVVARRWRVSMRKVKVLLTDPEGRQYQQDYLDVTAPDEQGAIDEFVRYNGIRTFVNKQGVKTILGDDFGPAPTPEVIPLEG